MDLLKQGKFWNARGIVSQSPKNPCQNCFMCWGFVEKQINECFNEKSHPSSLWIWLTHPRLCNIWPQKAVKSLSQLSVSVWGRTVSHCKWVGEGDEVAKSYLLPWEKDNKRGNEHRDRRERQNSPRQVKAGQITLQSLNVTARESACQWYSSYLICTWLLLFFKLADWVTLVH